MNEIVNYEVKQSSNIDQFKWSNYELYLSKELQLSLGIKGQVIKSTNIETQNLLQDFLLEHKVGQDSIIHTCTMGSSSFTGYIKHLVIAQGMSQYSSYTSNFMRNIPTALNPNLIAYYNLIDSPSQNYFIDIDDIYQVLDIQITKQNEPTIICSCQADYDDASNYILISNSSNFKEISNLFYLAQIDTNSIDSIEIKFSMQVQSITYGNYIQLMSHDDFWSIGIMGKQYLSVSGQEFQVEFDFNSQNNLNASIFQNAWIDYHIEITNSGVSLQINDFTESPIKQTINFNRTLDLKPSNTLSDKFVFSPVNCTIIFKYLNYSINGNQIFHFDFTPENFHFDQIGNINYLLNEQNKDFTGAAGYFTYRNLYNLSSTSLLFTQINGPCNQSDPWFQFDGLVCKSPRKSLALYQDTSFNGVLQSYTTTTSSQYTFEAWIKFQGFHLSNQTSATIMANYIRNLEPIIHISIGQQDSGFYLQCNPFVSSKELESMYKPVRSDSALLTNQWFHYACISNNIGVQYLESILFRHQNQMEITNRQLDSHTVNIPSTIPIRTLLGNQADLSSPFKGLIKEVRIWSEARTQEQVKLFRYQFIPSDDLRVNILAYLQLNQGHGNKILEISQANSSLSDFITSYEMKPIKWMSEDQLKICPSDTIYSNLNQCCYKNDFKANILSKVEQNNSTQDELVLKLNISYLYLAEEIKPLYFDIDWQLLQILNYEQEDYDQHLNDIRLSIANQSQGSTLEIRIPSIMLKKEAIYNISANVSSKLSSFRENQTLFLEYRPECPQIRILPSPNNQRQIISSKNMNPQDLKLSLEIYKDCQEQLFVNQVLWSFEPNINGYIIGKDNYSLSFNDFDWLPSDLKVTVIFIYEQNEKVQNISDNALIKLIDQPFKLQLQEIPQQLSLQDNLIINSTQSLIYANFIGSQSLQYKLDCPIELFVTYDQQQQFCSMDNFDGYQALDLKQLKIVYYAKYSFTFTMYSGIYNFSQSLTFNISFSRLLSFQCPYIGLNNYTFFQKSQDVFTFIPDVRLDCVETDQDGSDQIKHYAIQNVQWSVQEYSNASDFLNISSDKLIATVRNDIKKQIQPIYNKYINLQAYINGSFYNSSSLMVLQKSKIIIKYTTTLQNNIIDFDQTLIINASQSYDPDFPNDKIYFEWLCPNEQNQQTECEVQYFDKGVLTLNPLARLNSNFLIGRNNQIALKAFNLMYDNSQEIKNIDFKFELYDRNRTSFSDCYLKVNTSSDKIFVNKLNSSDFSFQVNFSSQECDYNLNRGESMFTFVSNLPNTMNKITYYEANSTFISKDQINQLAFGETIIIDFLILIYQTSPDRYQYIVKTITIQMVETPIQIVFNPSNTTLEIGQEESFTLDASQSFDPDNSSNKKYIYAWSCPDKLKCSGTGSKLQITRLMRIQGDLNKIGSYFRIGLTISSITNNKKSETIYRNVVIKEQDPQKCLDVSIPALRDSSIQIYRDQEFPVVISSNTSILCEITQIKNYTWESTNEITKYWLRDQLGQKLIIKSAQDLPLQSPTSMTLKVIFTNGNLNENLKIVPFTLEVQKSQIVTILKSNKIILNPLTQSLELDATQSFDPDNRYSNLLCIWSCPSQINNLGDCSEYNRACSLRLNPTFIPFKKANSSYEVIEFSAQTYNNDNTKSSSTNISITLIKPEIENNLPICSIISFKGDQISLYDELIFFADCEFKSSSADFSQLEIRYQWIVEPQVFFVDLNTNKLVIQPQMLLERQFINQDSLKIKLNVTAYEPKYQTFVPYYYEVKSQVKLPIFKSTSDQQISISVLPKQGYTLFTVFKIDICNFRLSQQQYFRIRTEKYDGSFEILISKSLNYTYNVIFPRDNIFLYVDVIEESRDTNERQYLIYSFQPKINVDQLDFLSVQIFNMMVQPKIEQDVQVFDSSDISQIENELNNQYSLVVAVSGIRKESQPYYVQLLINKAKFASNFVLQNSVQFMNQETQLWLQMKLLRVVTLLYSCLESSEDYGFNDLESIMFNQTMTNFTIQKVMLPETQNEIKKMMLQSLAYLAKSVKDIKKLEWIEETIASLLSSKLSQGESSFYYSILHNCKVIIKKVSKLDRQMRVNQTFISSNDIDKSFIVIPYNYMKDNYGFIEAGFRQMDDNIDYDQTEKNYTISKTQLLLSIKDQSRRTLSDISDFKAQITFEIQNSIINELRMRDNLSNLIFCVSKKKASDDQTFNSQGIITDLSNFQNGYITCHTSHLSVFKVIFTHSKVQTRADDTIKKNLLFDKLPILKIVLPATFFTFSLIFLVIGKTMAELDKSRPKRFYNKHTLQDNIQKYTLTRLTFCMILQFNPFTNFIFKPNYYLNRPIRLLILSIYFLLISSFNLLYFLSRPNELLIPEVFSISFLSFIIIIFFRPRLQECLFFLFYPQNLKQWKYFRSDGQENQRMMGQQIQIAEGAVDEEYSIRLEQSMNRMINSSDKIEKGPPEEVKGDEIIEFRSKKKKNPRIHQSQEMNMKLERQKKVFEEIELQDLSARRNENSMQDSQLFRLSLQNSEMKLIAQSKLKDKIRESEEHEEILDQQMEGGESDEELHQNQNEEKEVSVQDNLQEEILKQVQTIQGIQNLPNDAVEEQKEQLHIDLDEEENSVYETKAKKPKKRVKKVQDDLVSNNKTKKTRDPALNSNEHNSLDESTPSLETIYENYREYLKQDVNPFKKLIGNIILLLIFCALLFQHSFLMPNIEENQFQNWFSGTIYTFLVQICVIDSIMYLIMAKTLKKLQGTRDKRKLCSMFNIIILWPLGKYKLMELEIELAKLKDFDKDYEMLLYT